MHIEPPRVWPQPRSIIYLSLPIPRLEDKIQIHSLDSLKGHPCFIIAMAQPIFGLVLFGPWALATLMPHFSHVPWGFLPEILLLPFCLLGTHQKCSEDTSASLWPLSPRDLRPHFPVFVWTTSLELRGQAWFCRAFLLLWFLQWERWCLSALLSLATRWQDSQRNSSSLPFAESAEVSRSFKT